MSKPRREEKVVALKATSLRDSLATTVRLLTRQGIEVQFRGHQPYVASKGNKAIRLVLPELNDNASDELLEAIHGFLDHECGHIFYTPFARAQKAANGSRAKAAMLNIIEDIRLEKLLPRDLPGTKENLERMYEKAMPNFFGPSALEAHKASSPTQAFNCVLIVALRALAGQKAFQQFMDDNKLWDYAKPLLQAMPTISRTLRSLETYDDVEECVDAIIDALKPPPPPPAEEPEDQDEEDDAGNQPPQSAPPADPEDDADEDDDLDDGCDGEPGDDDGADQSGDDEDGDDDADSNGGEGHGDGEGTDDGNPDDEEEGDSAGDADADEEGDDEGDGSSDDLDTGATDKVKGDGKNNKTLTDALKMLEASQRQAIFAYKKRKQSVADIAVEMNISEDEVVDLLRTARRRISEILNGG